jgi:hypothetical protein
MWLEDYEGQSGGRNEIVPDIRHLKDAVDLSPGGNLLELFAYWHCAEGASTGLGMENSWHLSEE